MNLLTVLIGMVFFAITLKWWVIPLTLATYAALIFVAPRDQVVRNRILERHEGRSEAHPLFSEDQDILQRARRLPPGETRRKVEDALEARRQTIFAIEESGDVTQAVLFLADDERSGWITGVVLPVDGGVTAGRN